MVPSNFLRGKIFFLRGKFQFLAQRIYFPAREILLFCAEAYISDSGCSATPLMEMCFTSGYLTIYSWEKPNGHDSKTNLSSLAKDRRLLRYNGRNQGQKWTGQVIFNGKDLGF
jgi:hypothetical protein